MRINKMGLCATMVILPLGIFLGTIVDPADGLCLYDGRDWVDGGLDIVHDSWGSVANEDSSGLAMRCYSDEEKVAFVAMSVGLGIILVSVICCIACCCNTKSPRRPSSVVVVRRVKRSIDV